MQHIALGTHLAGVCEEIAGDGLVRAVLQFDAGQIGEVLDGHARVDGGDAAHECGLLLALAARFAGQVVFVADVADELFGHVLQRHDAVGAAVLVDDHGQVDAALAQQFEARQQLGRAGQRNAFSRHVGHGRCVGVAHVQQVAHMHEADHVIEIPAGHRIAGVRHLAHVRRRVLDALRTVEEHDIGARTHDLGDDGLGRVEHVVEDRALVFAQRRVRVDEHAQLLVGDLAFGLVRVEAEQAHDTVRVLADEPDDRLADLGEHVDRGHYGAGDLFGALHGDALRHHFGDDYRAVRDDQRQHDGGQRCGDVRRHAPAFHDGHDERRNRRFAERCGQEAGERHADLHGGQELVGVACDCRHTCATGVLLFHLIDLGSAQGDQGQFGAGEDGSEH